MFEKICNNPRHIYVRPSKVVISPHGSLQIRRANILHGKFYPQQQSRPNLPYTQKWKKTVTDLYFIGA